MRVLCINDQGWVRIHDMSKEEIGPEYMEECLAISEVTVEGIPCYVLQEYPDPEGYVKRCFIPLSEIDELELVKEREGELV